jgi:uncharacterized HAD superfamily protein
MVFAIDMDDVLVNTVQTINLFHNEKFGTNYHYDDYKSFYLWKTWGGDRKDIIEKMDQYYHSAYFDNIRVCDEVLPIIGKLADDGHDLYLVTSRPKCVSEKTEKFLSKKFKNIFRQVIFTDHCIDGENYKRKKSDVCRELGADVMIEDCPDYIRDCAKVVPKVLVPVRPWNIEDFPENVIHFLEWKKIWELI